MLLSLRETLHDKEIYDNVVNVAGLFISTELKNLLTMYFNQFYSLFLLVLN